MATLQQIATSFNANFRLHSDGEPAQIGPLDDGQYVAIFEDETEVFAVPDDAPNVRLNTYTQQPANHLWRKVRDKRKRER
jgi:hypothetical protein